jgi:peptide-methionine (S)-S-oxide reductase
VIFQKSNKQSLPSEDEALPGRDESIDVPAEHRVLGTPLEPPFPDDTREIVVGMGCFWGPEKLFWETEGVYTTAVGYAGGHTPNPTYEEVCSGKTGHTEVVRVVFYPDGLSDRDVLEMFWDNHDPTQGMRQGVDRGTQYRSAIYATDQDQFELAEATREARQSEFDSEITTEIREAPEFYYAEPYHQQYSA